MNRSKLNRTDLNTIQTRNKTKPNDTKSNSIRMTHLSALLEREGDLKGILIFNFVENGFKLMGLIYIEKKNCYMLIKRSICLFLDKIKMMWINDMFYYIVVVC